MDEIPIYVEMVPSHTVEKKGTNEVKLNNTGAGKRCGAIVWVCATSGKTLATHDNFPW